MSSTPDGAPAYLDSASSERLHPAARQTLLAALDRGFADPRRVHPAGRDARLLLENARAVIAECLGVRDDEVSFTASGTEAVHRGLLGLAAGRPSSGRRIVLPAVEHASVRHAAQWWGEPTILGVSPTGAVDADDVRVAAEADDVAVVAVQQANHEVGTLQPLADLDLPHDRPLFVDACAAVGRLPLPEGDWQALAASAHKWGGPAGVGVLVVRNRARWLSPFPADDRVDHRATGFENVPAALAAAAALQAVVTDQAAAGERHRLLIDRIRAAASALPDTEVVGDPVLRLPHLVTFSCLYVAGDALVDALAREGFAVASGSACTASSLEPSHVLAAMGALTHGNVRVSLGPDTTAEEVERFCAVLPGVVAELRR